MVADPFALNPLHALGVERSVQAPDGDETAWAHVSGWAQLSGKSRRISCVIVCRNSATTLEQLLPALSDALTEIGFPWEIVLVERASEDGSRSVLLRWSEIPGFRWLRFAQDCGASAATYAGLSEARGDAVILLNAAAEPPIDRLPDLVDLWEQGHGIALVSREPADGGTATSVGLYDFLDAARNPRAALTTLSRMSDPLLMDRQSVDALLQSEAR